MQPSETTPQPKQELVAWGKTCGLAGVQGAITLSWVVYNLYLPQLLQNLGLDKSLALSLLVVESFLAAGIEPVIGFLSDRDPQSGSLQDRAHFTTKLPLIVATTSAAALLFALLPHASSQSLLLGLSIAWAVAMAAFRPPVMSFLGEFAFKAGLPQAVSVLTLAGGIAGSLRFSAQTSILKLGATTAFLLSSVILLAAIFLLRFLVLREPSSPSKTYSARLPIGRILFLFGFGLMMGWSLRLLLGESIPRLLRNYEVSNFNLWMSLTFLLMSIFAVISGYLTAKIAHRQRNHWSLAAGSALIVVSLGLLLLKPPVAIAFLLAIILLAGLGTVANSPLPLALEFFPSNRGGLALGLYFGATGLAAAIFNLAIPKPAESLDLLAAVLFAQGAVALAGIGALLSTPLQE
ncbi:MFS transporter [Oscillatoria sp. FACHB-1406]|uniref:MFS transporter n=1 Tax=Oscillatoria sp. FACHB-1406 TaxID=2692846 RepID=UPI0016887FDD|nr:MFS transporter [Oscillatoria sp. FACHB-1406]MBD2576765.1 MFS transporter [Oscillatoria sp. FACHB-1406]